MQTKREMAAYRNILRKCKKGCLREFMTLFPYTLKFLGASALQVALHETD